MNLPFSNPGNGRSDGPSEYDTRPVVAIRRQDRSAWWFASGALIAAVLLFSALEARRRGAEQAKAQAAAGTALAASDTIPELTIPAAPIEPSPALIGPDGWPEPGTPQQPAATIFQPQPRAAVQQPVYQSQPGYGESVYQAPPPPIPSGREIAAPAFDTPLPPSNSAAASGSNRIRAGRLENPSTTVIQGTLINAVLETALDSTRPGQTRAVVTRDVYGFDGKRLLIPRGTRLYGSYEADVAQGQKRAQVRWTRLLRPDGVSVALDSPGADPLGRAGVAGKVNSHFFQRLGNALIGTTASVGSALVTRSIVSSSPVVVAVPGATQSVSQTVTPSSTQIMPTLTVRQGTRITVFVQHDLDFTSVDEAP